MSRFVFSCAFVEQGAGDDLGRAAEVYLARRARPHCCLVGGWAHGPILLVLKLNVASDAANLTATTTPSMTGASISSVSQRTFIVSQERLPKFLFAELLHT